jgi:hypothetical protein
MRFVEKERCDRRLIAALRCVDGITQGSIRQPLQLSAAGSRFTRNRRGLYVLLQAPGFETYRHTFDLESLAVLPSVPPLEITVTDPSGQYLPRRFSLSLPRGMDDTVDDYLFRPALIRLYPSPLGATNPGWAVLRTTVMNDDTNQRLPWALVEVVQNGQTTLSQADWRGEALVAVPGIPVTTWSSGEAPAPASTTEVSAQLTVLFDPAVTPLADLADLISLRDLNADYLPNPDQLNSNRVGLLTGTQTLLLASGRDRSYRLAVTLTPIP